MRDDAGGVWIATGWAVGLVVYAGVVLMAVAGVAAVIPLVVVPPVLVGLIGAGNLLGGRSHGRSSQRSARAGRPPRSTSGPDGPPGSDRPGRADASEEAGTRP